MIYRQAITVKFIAPTNRLGARYKASCAHGALTLHADHSLNPAENAEKAMRALVSKFIMEDYKRDSRDLPANNPWRGKWVGGQIEDGRYVFVTGGAFAGNYIHIDQIGGKYVEDYA